MGVYGKQMHTDQGLTVFLFSYGVKAIITARDANQVAPLNGL